MSAVFCAMPGSGFTSALAAAVPAAAGIEENARNSETRIRARFMDFLRCLRLLAAVFISESGPYGLDFFSPAASWSQQRCAPASLRELPLCYIENSRSFFANRLWLNCVFLSSNF